MEDTATLQSVEEIAEGLSVLGYEAEVQDSMILTRINTFPVLLSVGETEMSMTCEIAEWGQIPEDKISAVAMAALDANTCPEMGPFAFGTITSSDDPENDDGDKWPLVLVDTVPLGDFSISELGYQMDQLLGALVASRDVLGLAFDA